LAEPEQPLQPKEIAMSASVNESVSGIIAAFEGGDIPVAIAQKMFPI